MNPKHEPYSICLSCATQYFCHIKACFCECLRVINQRVYRKTQIVGREASLVDISKFARRRPTLYMLSSYQGRQDSHYVYPYGLRTFSSCLVLLKANF